MGLDMYLTAEFYVGGGYDYIRKEAAKEDGREDAKREVSQFDTIISALGISHLREKLSEMETVQVDVRVAYWRKVNAVHSWFVQNTQGGKDECQRSWVSREQLQELVNACKQILATVDKGEVVMVEREAIWGGGEYETYPNLTVDKELAERLLAPKQGFFFGSYDYDDWYVTGLQQTVDQLEVVLAEPTLEHCEFYYRASW